MAIYDTGTASLASNGQVTGVGTQWTMPLTLIRVGATIVFKTEPVQIYTISEITSDTSMAVYNPNGETVPSGTGYAILAHDGISVQGLAQNVAETLRYYQSKETSIQGLLDFIGQDSFDWPRFEQLANQSVEGAAEALASQISAAESAATAVSARDTTTAARDETIAAINNAGDAGTLVTLAGWGIGNNSNPLVSGFDWQQEDLVTGQRMAIDTSTMLNTPEAINLTGIDSSRGFIECNDANDQVRDLKFTISTASDSVFVSYLIRWMGAKGSRTFAVREDLAISRNENTGSGSDAGRIRGLLDVYSKTETLQKSSNLSDVPDKAVARDNLDVYSKVEVNSAINIHRSDISRFGYNYGSGDDAADSIIRAINETGGAHLSGDITVSAFGWPSGAKLSGKSNITYTRRPDRPCRLNTIDEKASSTSKIKGVYVFGDFNAWDMLQIKTAGFNTIMHYQYSFYSDGNIGQVINACNAVGLNLVINSPNDNPDSEIVSIINNNDCVIGVYVFDEPQHNNVTREAQDLRIGNWRAVTSKQIWTTDNGIFGLGNDTFSPNYDVVLVDQYHIGSESDPDNKAFALAGWAELNFKCGNAKTIPAVGLFLGDSQTNKQKQIALASDFFKFGGGDSFCFAWDSSASDPNQVDLITDIDFYNTAVMINKSLDVKGYSYEMNYFGSGVGLSPLVNSYIKDYSSEDVVPFACVNAGSAIDERRQAFSDSGICFRNNGGIAALRMKSLGFVCASLSYRNHADGASSSTITVFSSPDDFYSSSDLISKTLEPNQGFTSGESYQIGSSIGIRVEPDQVDSFFLKYVSGFLITSDWINDL